MIADPPLNLFGSSSRATLRARWRRRGDQRCARGPLRAEGDNFSAGANVEIFLGRDEAAARELIEEFMPAIRRFAEIEVPTVAAVQDSASPRGWRSPSGPDLGRAGAQLGLVEA